MPELSGVKGDSAQGKLGWAGWETPTTGSFRRDKVQAEYIRCALGAGESERPVVAEKFRSESGWSQGALAKVMLSQRPLELIG